MPLRVLVYVGLLYQDLIREKKVTSSGKLPPVLPLVLYNGDRRWDAPVEMGDLMEDIPGGLSRYRPQFTFLLVDEGAYRDDDLKLLRNLASALFRLENSRDPEHILEAVTLLLEWLAAPEQDSLRRAFTVWFNRVFFASRKDEPKPPELRELTEVRAMLAERVEEWKREGLEEGRKEGEANILLKFLELKFGELSLEDQKKVQSADSDTLLKWTGQILTADTLDEILTTKGSHLIIPTPYPGWEQKEGE